MLSGNVEQVIGENRKGSQNKLNIVGANGGGIQHRLMNDSFQQR